MICLNLESELIPFSLRVERKSVFGDYTQVFKTCIQIQFAFKVKDRKRFSKEINKRTFQKLKKPSKNPHSSLIERTI